MKITHKLNLIAVALFGELVLTNAHAQDLSSKELNHRTVERRAVDAVIWGLPLVGEYTVKQASFRLRQVQAAVLLTTL
jgi:hypothetical protein